MPEEPRLTPATAEDLEQALAFALRFDGRKRTHTGDELMARITAEPLVKYLDRAGFVVMRRLASGDLQTRRRGSPNPERALESIKPVHTLLDG